MMRRARICAVATVCLLAACGDPVDTTTTGTTTGTDTTGTGAAGDGGSGGDTGATTTSEGGGGVGGTTSQGGSGGTATTGGSGGSGGSGGTGGGTTTTTTTGGQLICDPQLAFEESAACFKGDSGDGCCDMLPTDLAGNCVAAFGPDFSTPAFCTTEAGAPMGGSVTCQLMERTTFPCFWGASQLYCCAN